MKKRIFIFLIINLLFKGILLLYPINSFEGKTTIDDTYYSLSIAKSIAEGKGPLYGDNFTNGFQPLYVFLAVPAFWITSDLDAALQISLFLLLLFDCLSLYLLLNILILKNFNVKTIYFGSLLWIFNIYIIKNTFNGLETIIATSIILWIYLIFIRIQNNPEFFSSFDVIHLGFLICLAVLSRIDTVFFLISIGFITYSRYFKENKKLIKKILLSVALSLALYLPWLSYSFAYTGEIFPISGKAVRLMSTVDLEKTTNGDFYFNVLFRFFFDFIANNYQLLSLIGITASFIKIFKNRIPIKNLVKSNNVIILYIILLFLAYVYLVPAYWFFGRYLFNVVILLILLELELFDHLINYTIKYKYNKLLYLFPALAILTFLSNSNTQNIYFNLNENKQSYRQFALMLNSDLPKGTVIGASQSGALGYYCRNLIVVNLDGVVNKDCYNSLVKKDNMNYIKSKKIEYVVGWEDNISFIKDKSINFQESDLSFVKKIEDFKIWNQDWYIYKVNY